MRSNFILIMVLAIAALPLTAFASEPVGARPSDVRLKRNTVPLRLGLEQIDALRGVTYQWRPDTDQYQRTGSRAEIGLIAQEVQAIVPDAVVPIPAAPREPRQRLTLNQQMGTTLAVDYAQLVPLLVVGIQALHAANTALTRRVEQLEARITSTIPVAHLPRADIAPASSNDR